MHGLTQDRSQSSLTEPYPLLWCSSKRVMLDTVVLRIGKAPITMEPTQLIDHRSRNWNRWAYITFTLAGIIFWLVSDDRTLPITFLSIALVADPFDQQVTWSKRPLWQRAWLVVHMGLAAAALGWAIGLGDRS
jgi:hypothetical protein